MILRCKRTGSAIRDGDHVVVGSIIDSPVGPLDMRAPFLINEIYFATQKVEASPCAQNSGPGWGPGDVIGKAGFYSFADLDLVLAD